MNSTDTRQETRLTVTNRREFLTAAVGLGVAAICQRAVLGEAALPIIDLHKLRLKIRPVRRLKWQPSGPYDGRNLYTYPGYLFWEECDFSDLRCNDVWKFVVSTNGSVPVDGDSSKLRTLPKPRNIEKSDLELSFVALSDAQPCNLSDYWSIDCTLALARASDRRTIWVRGGELPTFIVCRV